MPFSLPSPFSITRFNFFCLQVLLTRASLLAVAKSVYIMCYVNDYYPDVSFSLPLKFPFVFLRKKYPMFGLKSSLYHIGKHDHLKKI